MPLVLFSPVRWSQPDKTVMPLRHNYSMHLHYHPPHPPPPPPPTTALYRPHSPTSSDNSSDNSNHKAQQEQSIRIDTASQVPGPYNPFDSPNPNPSRPSSSSPPERSSARYGVHHRHPDADAVFPPEYQPSSSSASASYHSRRSPPPEPIFPTSQPGHQPAAWQDFAYVPSSRGALSPPSSASGPALVPTPPPQTGASSEPRPDASSIAATWRQPSPPTAAAPDDANVDQLIYELISPTHPGMGSPPDSPKPLPPTATPELSSHASGSRGAVLLASAPAPPVYHPHLQYPISPPGGKADLEGKTYSFVSLPGNTIKKRPRRRYEEIERLYKCNFEGCSKSYGTLNHLNAHVHMQRHGAKRTPGEFKEMRKVWRKQRKEAEEDESMVAGPSSAGTVGPSAPYDRGPRPKRRRRATEPSLPSIATLEDSTEEDFTRRESGPREQPYGHIPAGGGRRVSMDEYMEAGHQRRPSLDSHEGTIPEEMEEEEQEAETSPLATQRSVSTTMSVATRAAALQLSPVVASGAPLSSVRYWQQHPGPAPQEPVHLHPVGAQPIHPPPLVHQETLPHAATVAPHASHLPGPGPAAPATDSSLGQDTSHSRSGVSYQSPTQPPATQPRQPVYPPAVPRSGARHPSLSFSESQQQASNTAPLSPPPLQQARLGSPVPYQPPRSIQQVAATVILAPTPQPQNLPSLTASQQQQQTGRIGMTYPMSPPSHLQSGTTSGYPVTPPTTIHPAYPSSPAPAQQQQHGSHAHPAYPPTHTQITHAAYSHQLSRPLPSLPGGGYLSSPPQYPASPPRTEPLQSEQRLHAGSMLLTPLSLGHPHRLPYLPSVVSPTNYVTGGSSLAGAVGTPEGRGPGLPIRYGVTSTPAPGAASGRSMAQQQHYNLQREQRYEPQVQQQQSQPQWETTYSTTSSASQPQQSQQQHLYHRSDSTYDAALSRPVATSRTSYTSAPAQTQLDAYAQQRAQATYLASPTMLQRSSSSDTYTRYIPTPTHSQRQDTYPTATTSSTASQQVTDALGYGRGQQQMESQAGTYEGQQSQRMDSFSQSQQMSYYAQPAVSESYYAPPQQQQQQQQHSHGAYSLQQQHQQLHQSQQPVASPIETSAEQYSTISPQNVQQGGIPPQAQHQPQDPRLYPSYGARGHPGPSDSGY